MPGRTLAVFLLMRFLHATARGVSDDAVQRVKPLRVKTWRWSKLSWHIWALLYPPRRVKPLTVKTWRWSKLSWHIWALLYPPRRVKPLKVKTWRWSKCAGRTAGVGPRRLLRPPPPLPPPAQDRGRRRCARLGQRHCHHSHCLPSQDRG